MLLNQLNHAVLDVACGAVRILFGHEVDVDELRLAVRSVVEAGADRDVA